MINTSNPQSICIIRLSAIGDCINVIPVVQLILKQYPEINITWITEKIELEVLDFLPSSVNFITYNKKGGLKEILRIKKLLKSTKFDYLLHMQSAFKASLLSLAISAKCKIGFNKERSKDLQSFFVNKQICQPQTKHVVDGFMEFAYAIGCSREKPTWDIKINTESKKRIENLNLGNAPICLINPCTSKSYKNWTVEGYTKICQYMNEKGFQTILIGGNSEEEQLYNQHILAATKSKTSSLIGKTSIKDLMALINIASVVISADTAAVHFANALNIPVIGLYAIHDPLRVGPYNQLDNTVSIYDECALSEYHKKPEELPWRTRIHNKEAMKKISFDMVKTQIDKICKDIKL